MLQVKIAQLIPHHDAMCLLSHVEGWTPDHITCLAHSHLSPANPLRRAGRLSTICGSEYGFQAAALHGALLAGGIAQPPGYLASLRISHIAQPYLDDPGLGTLRVKATREASQAAGLVYGFLLYAETGTRLLEGRATIALQR